MNTQMVTDRRPSDASRFWKFSAVAALIVAAVGIGTLYLERQKVAQQSSVIQAQEAAMSRQATMLQAEAKPDLPLTVWFRRAVFGAGDVMTVRNNSGNPLDLALIVASNATGLVQRRELLIQPNRLAMLGPAQRLVLAPGQRVLFRTAGFKQAVYVVP
jgi:hypothetical protein